MLILAALALRPDNVETHLESLRQRRLEYANQHLLEQARLERIFARYANRQDGLSGVSAWEDLRVVGIAAIDAISLLLDAAQSKGLNRGFAASVIGFVRRDRAYRDQLAAIDRCYDDSDMNRVHSCIARVLALASCGIPSSPFSLYSTIAVRSISNLPM